MSEQPHGPSYRTSLPLIALTLVVGIALGWLLHDVVRRTTAPLPSTPATTAVVSPTALALAASALPPTDVPTFPPTQLPAPSATTQPLPTTAPTVIPEPTVAPQPTATSEPTATPEPTVEPTAAPVAVGTSYIGHQVVEGETLESIAAAAGSTAELISSYNRLNGEPQPGRSLIIPRLPDASGTIESEPLLVQRGPSSKPWVALTLDAGASAEPVPQMLQTLRERNIRITFFLTGKWIQDNPDLTRQIVADGHEIANHTFNHPDLTRVGDEALRAELADTEKLLSETAGATSRPLFRPPYGAYDKRVLRDVIAEGYLPIYWTLDSLDSVGEPKTADFLFERVTAKLSPEQLRGAIILAHCGSQPTADALPRILDRFAEMGFEVKKVSEVLQG